MNWIVEGAFDWPWPFENWAGLNMWQLCWQPHITDCLPGMTVFCFSEPRALGPSSVHLVQTWGQYLKMAKGKQSLSEGASFGLPTAFLSDCNNNVGNLFSPESCIHTRRFGLTVQPHQWWHVIRKNPISAINSQHSDNEPLMWSWTSLNPLWTYVVSFPCLFSARSTAENIKKKRNSLLIFFYSHCHSSLLNSLQALCSLDESHHSRFLPSAWLMSMFCLKFSADFLSICFNSHKCAEKECAATKAWKWGLIIAVAGDRLLGASSRKPWHVNIV